MTRRLLFSGWLRRSTHVPQHQRPADWQPAHAAPRPAEKTTPIDLDRIREITAGGAQ